MYGLVLGGGGAKGAYQIGVWRAIKELNIDVGYVCGTSVGALNGAFFAMKEYDTAYKMWSELGMQDVFKGDEETFEGIDKIANEGVFAATFNFLKHTTKQIIDHKGLDITPLRSMIAEYLDEEVLRNSGIGFGLVALSINDRKALRLNVEDIERGELKYYLLGSAMIPGFTQDESFEKKFVDGGLYDNFPIKMAYEKGYRKIIGVGLFGRKIKPKYKDADVVGIYPTKNLGNILYFNKDNAITNMELGYLDAMKAFGEFKGNEYYFKNVPEESELLKSLCQLSEEDKMNISKWILREDYKSDKMFFERVLYKLGKNLDVPSEGTYQDLFIHAVEKLMKHDKYDDIKVYDFAEMVEVLEYDKKNKLLKTVKILIDSIK